MQIKAVQLVTRHLVNVIQRIVLHVEVKAKGIFTYSNMCTRTCRGHMVVVKLMLSLAVFSMYGCGMTVKPSTTTVTYGESHTDTEKVANNDSSVDSDKTTWSIKQVFKWASEE